MKAKLTCLAPMLTVKSIHDAAAYYRDRLGFQVCFVAESETMPSYGVLERDGLELHLIEDPGHDAGKIENGFNATVTDVDALFEEFSAHKAFAPGFPRDLDAIREHPPEDKEYGMRDIIFVDANGYILVFGQPIENCVRP